MLYRPKTILVTGAAGFIGANFVRYWLSAYPDSSVIALDALTYAGTLENLKRVETSKNYEFVHLNILETDKLIKLISEKKIDTIVHFAAESHVDRSILAPDLFIQNNVVGTLSLLNAAKSVWLDKGMFNHRFHHISTDEVFGSLAQNTPPVTELAPYFPNSPYSASKAASDHLVRSYFKTYGLNVTTSHCSNNFGPYQHSEKLIPLIVKCCLAWESIPIYGNGLQIRDWMYVTDHCEAIDKILVRGTLGETYNIGANTEKNNLEVVKYICSVMDRLRPVSQPYNTLITHVSDRAGHDLRYGINTDKIEKELDFKCRVSFEEGIDNTVEWYLNNK